MKTSIIGQVHIFALRFMSIDTAPSPDKTIVERRVAHAGDMSRAAVRELRAGLGQTPTAKVASTAGFAADVLRHHARIQRQYIGAQVVFSIIAAFLTLGAVGEIVTGIWLSVSLVISLATFATARRFLAEAKTNVNCRKWEKAFIGLAAAQGFAWAVLFAFYPINESGGTFSTLVFAATIIVTAMAFVGSRLLRFGVLISCLPFIAMVSGKLLIQFNMSSAAFAVLILAALAFFEFLGHSIRNSHLEFLRSRAERDQLIVELEASRGISEEARRRAEDANLAKSRFLATMSHELRTPLNAILGFSEVISNEVMGPLNNAHYKEYITDIHRSGAHLLKLINEILDLSRVEAGRYELNEEAINLAHAAEESQQMVKLKASENNVNLLMQIQPDMPQIWVDARAIRQVILNLLSNALKFTPSGGTIWLKVGWTAGGGQYVSIKDTGPGIPEEEIPIVLSSFGQGSIAIKSAEQGTGLGLPIVQALVHMHDGKFELKSKLREGTEVIATFPRSRVLEVMPAIPVEGQPAKNTSGIRRKVEAPKLSA